MKDDLGDRMKGQYENRTRYLLPRRTYTIIRIDGKAFHTYTRGFVKPFDDHLVRCMQEVARFLCQNIQGAKFGYTQSDEISIVLTDFDDIKTDAWFDGNIQKMCSVSASLATAKFNQLIEKDALAFFDSRVFTIPDIEEVVNYFVWRQQDATRNSIQSVARSLYSHSQVHNKNTSQLQELIFQKGINWNDYQDYLKRGTTIYKTKRYIEVDGDMLPRNTWEIGYTSPVFTQDRDYIKNKIKKG